MEPVYLDHAATTPLVAAVRERLLRYLDHEFGNPSSRHALGVSAAEAVDAARRQVARASGARAGRVVFTSGGTEANNLAVLGMARARAGKGASGARRGRVVIGPTEHPSVRESAQALAAEGFEVVHARLDGRGGLDLASYEELVDPDTVLVAQMLVNNEFGTVYPLRELARIVRARAPGAALHCDAVQGLGKLELSLEELGVDSLALSAHKVHAPKGSGALVLGEGVRVAPLAHGGGQQEGLRPGTENVAGAAAFGLAAELAERERPAACEHARSLRRRLLSALEHVPGARVIEPGEVVPAICALSLPGAPGEVWQHHLESRGIMIGVGSACQSRSKDVSPALAALGLAPDEARRVVRVSFARVTTAAEVDRASEALIEVAGHLGSVRT